VDFNYAYKQLSPIYKTLFGYINRGDLLLDEIRHYLSKIHERVKMPGDLKHSVLTVALAFTRKYERVLYKYGTKPSIIAATLYNMARLHQQARETEKFFRTSLGTVTSLSDLHEQFCSFQGQPRMKALTKVAPCTIAHFAGCCSSTEMMYYHRYAVRENTICPVEDVEKTYITFYEFRIPAFLLPPVVIRLLTNISKRPRIYALLRRITATMAKIKVVAVTHSKSFHLFIGILRSPCGVSKHPSDTSSRKVPDSSLPNTLIISPALISGNSQALLACGPPLHR
jgi:hypothetical protein